MSMPESEIVGAMVDAIGPEGANPGDYMFLYEEDYELEDEEGEELNEAD